MSEINDNFRKRMKQLGREVMPDLKINIKELTLTRLDELLRYFFKNRRKIK